ncbi:MAG TPA: glycoside hydrolase family 5 protein, partial [Gemmatimonadaceae bacterium]|nr:glycoside hydrolase family 5 protein [Gemmatimonadaceae bacterium]
AASGGTTGGTSSATGGTGGTGGSTGGTGGTTGGTGGSTSEGGAAGDRGGEAAALPWIHVDGNQFKDENGNVVVLRGVDMIDLGATEQWEGGIKQMIDRLTDPNDTQSNSPGWGTKVLRLVVAPADAMIGTPAPYSPGTQYYETYLRPTVDYARQKGLYAIIDWHYIDDTTPHIDSTNAFWDDIAPHFADDSNVFFELFNEPMDMGNWTTTKANMQTWYTHVRAAAPNNVVLVGSSNWSQLAGTAAADPIDGTNIAYVSHMYPTHFMQQSLRTQITNAAAIAPVFMTEWGFEEGLTDDGGLLNGTITSYGDPIRTFMEQNGLSWSAWCASAKWDPPMFNADYSLRVGEGEMGGFVKDWLYDKRDDDQPMP